MLATRKLCASAGPSLPKLILPPVTFSEVASSALQGAWAHITSQDCRDLYESMVADDVIKDTVLHQASNGSTLTFCLFNNLKNPLFEKYKFDAKEFVRAAGPALENFHDTLGQLRNQLAETLEKDNEKSEDKMEQSEEEIISGSQQNTMESLLGVNLWRRQADDDKDSPAGLLSRMASDGCFDALYYTSKIDMLSRSNLLYVDCAVNEVALLSARAAFVRNEGGDSAFEYEEFQATEELENKLPIGAQLDVLFEITHTFKHPPSSNAAENENDIKEGENDNNKSDDNAHATNDDGYEVTVITNLAVAIFEGWLHKRGEGLRWKIALIREAYEFPHSMTSVTGQ